MDGAIGSSQVSNRPAIGRPDERASVVVMMMSDRSPGVTTSVPGFNAFTTLSGLRAPMTISPTRAFLMSPGRRMPKPRSPGDVDETWRVEGRLVRGDGEHRYPDLRGFQRLGELFRLDVATASTADDQACKRAPLGEEAMLGVGQIADNRLHRRVEAGHHRDDLGRQRATHGDVEVDGQRVRGRGQAALRRSTMDRLRRALPRPVPRSLRAA